APWLPRPRAVWPERAVRGGVSRRDPAGAVGQIPLLHLESTGDDLSDEATNPRVSVVIANYNYGRYLAAAVESVIAQTFHNWELIVVDDGSTDASLAVVEPHTADSRVHVLRVNHLGQPGAKNAGITAARGEIIAFLDADDLWHPQKLEQQLALMES